MFELTGPQYEQFSEVIRRGFTPAELRRMLEFRLDKSLDDLSLASDYQQIVFDVIGASRRQGWTDRLLLASREQNPNNALLLAFAQQFGLVPGGTPTRPNLEKLIVDTNAFLDITKWRERLGEIEVRVCRVEVDGAAAGTGFLLGPDVVMTNFHVIESVQQMNPGPEGGKRVQVRFDYKQLSTGETFNPGQVFGLAEDWLIDSSPYSDIDFVPEPKNGAPEKDQLDYALLRVTGAPGSKPIGEKSSGEDKKRGWLTPLATPYAFQPNTPLFIVQHPKGAPLKLALDTNAVINVNSNATRVAYRTNSEPGSSGSPVFNANWELVALHHAGDPAWTPAFNEGIPFTAIKALLAGKPGLGDLLGGQPPAQPAGGVNEL
jgi:hypothetical protein